MYPSFDQAINVILFSRDCQCDFFSCWTKISAWLANVSILPYFPYCHGIVILPHANFCYIIMRIYHITSKITKCMLKCLCIGENLYFVSESVGNDISSCACTERYINVSIILRHDISRLSIYSSFSQDLGGS